MTRQNLWLTIAIGVLVVLNIYLASYEPANQRLDYDPSRFQVADTSSIQAISVRNDDLEVSLQRANGWRITGEWESDPYIRRLFMSLMQRVSVTRKLSETPTSLVTPISIIITTEEGTKAFKVAGNANKTRTFFIQDDVVYEMEIPGYTDYVGAVFELHPDQWRNRLLINANWRSIQKLKLDYTQGEKDDFQINFDASFFKVSGLMELDSNRVVDYLNQFEFLQANEIISPGRFPEFDSLMQTEPAFVVTIEDIKYSDKKQMIVYPKLPGSDFQLVSDENNTMMIFEERRLNPLAVGREFFAYRSEE
jgi:hypothetical protein